MKRLIVFLPILCLISCTEYNDIETIVQIQGGNLSSELVEQTRQQLIDRLQEVGLQEVSVRQGEVPIQFVVSAKVGADDAWLQQYHGVFRKGTFGIWKTYRITDPEVKVIVEQIQKMPEKLTVNAGQYHPSVFAGAVDAEDLAPIKEDLEKRIVDVENVKFLWSKKVNTYADNTYQLYAIDTKSKTATISNEHITYAGASYDGSRKIYTVDLTMNSEGTELWSRMTRQELKREIAVVLDDKVCVAPTVQSPITNGRTEITGNFTYGEALQVSDLLQSVPLPYSLKIIDEKITRPE